MGLASLFVVAIVSWWLIFLACPIRALSWCSHRFVFDAVYKEGGRIESGQVWRELLLLVVIPRVVVKSVEIGYV